MRYEEYPAPPGSSGLVRFCWSVESDLAGDAPYRLTAETCANIIFIRQGAFTEADRSIAPRAHLAGPISRHTDMIAHGPFRIFGAYLWPWSTAELFGGEVGHYFDRFLDLRTLFGPGSGPIIERLLGPADIPHSAQLLGELLGPCRLPAPPDGAMQQLIRDQLISTMPRDTEDLAAASGLARRQFERRFKACTGLSPALFMRIVRFQRCYRMLENGTAASLTEVAHAAGYFDQSHFIRDFKRFSGMNPRHYFIKAPEKVDNFVRLR